MKVNEMCSAEQKDLNTFTSPPFFPEQVGSLSLQGTYAGKIVSLGDGLKCFKNLKFLDLSKNLLVSLEVSSAFWVLAYVYTTKGPERVCVYNQRTWFNCF